MKANATGFLGGGSFNNLLPTTNLGYNQLTKDIQLHYINISVEDQVPKGNFSGTMTNAWRQLVAELDCGVIYNDVIIWVEPYELADVRYF